MGIQLRTPVSTVGAHEYRWWLMGVLSELLALQKTDIAISQARHRLAHLPQIVTHKEAVTALASVKQQCAVAVRRHAEAQVEITQLETESHQLDIKAERLKKQLRSVIAPREAEALQHEIADCEATRGSLDDKELGLLELVEALTSEVESLTERERVESGLVAASLGALQGMQVAIRHEVQELEERRSAMCLVISG
ncbi:MAG: zinc ribbon domain-containing protein, partial [Ilumatobacteraceae bacterium]